MHRSLKSKQKNYLTELLLINYLQENVIHSKSKVTPFEIAGREWIELDKTVVHGTFTLAKIVVLHFKYIRNALYIRVY